MISLTFDVYWQDANGCLVLRTATERTAIQVDVMRGAENENPFTITPKKCKYQIVATHTACTHTPVVSMLLYAQAAAGPEYEYPACLEKRASIRDGGRPQMILVTHGAMMAFVPATGGWNSSSGGGFTA